MLDITLRIESCRGHKRSATEVVAGAGRTKSPTRDGIGGGMFCEQDHGFHDSALLSFGSWGTRRQTFM